MTKFTSSNHKGTHGGARVGAGRPRKKVITTSLPFYLDKASAGFGATAIDYFDQQLNLNDFFCKDPSNSFCMQVKGNSMVEAGIQDGDIIIVEKSFHPEHGKIVIANIDDEVFIKKFKNKDGIDFLCSANPEYPDFSFRKHNIKIIGTVKAVIHRF